MLVRLRFQFLILWTLCFAAGSAGVAAAQGSISHPQPLAPGAEALGRGGAFVAKADSPLALEYNVAGLAKLRGTHVLVEGALFMPTYSSDCRDWRGDKRRPCYGGMLAVATDFGVLRRWTITAGLRVPEYVSGYGVSTNILTDGALIPFYWPPALFLSPSLSVSVAAHPRLALGLTFEDAMAVAIVACPYPSSIAPDCSGPKVQERSLINPVLQLGLLGQLGSERSAVMLGASVRSAPNLGLRPMLSNPSVDLPWTIRAGARFLHRTDRGAAADIELDGVAQVWTPIESFAPQTARNSLGLRLGGSYGAPVRSVMLAARAGFMFDWDLRAQSSFEIAGFGQIAAVELVDATVFRLSGTAGVGIETRRFATQLGYGYVSEHIRSHSSLIGNSRQSSHLLSVSALLRI